MANLETPYHQPSHPRGAGAGHWRAVDRSRLLAVTALLAALVLWAAVKQMDSPGQRQAGINLLQVASALAAAGVAVRRVRTAAGSTRRHLVLLCAAAASWAAGQAYWTVNEVLLSRPVPFPSAADAGFLLAYPLLIIALLRAPASQSDSRSGIRRIFDWLVVACAMVFLSWATVLDSVFHALDPTTAAGALGLAYPIADLLLVTVAAGTFVRARLLWRTPLAFAALGLGALGVADIGFAYLQSNGTYATGSVIDLGWILGWLLVAIGALTVPTRDRAPRLGSIDPPSRAATAVPLIAMAAVAVTATVLQVTGAPFTDDPVLWWTGLSVFTLTVARSVAARAEGDAHAAQLSLQAAELAGLIDRHGLALSAAAMGTWEWDIAGDVVRWSPELERLLGMELGSFGGTLGEAIAVVHPDDKARTAAVIKTAIERSSDYETEYRAVRADGTVMWVQSRGRAITDASGTVTGVVGVDIDVTKRVAADERLEMRVRQGAALAELGQRAVTATTLQQTLDDAIATVADTLDLELCKVLQREPDGASFRLVAGCGWAPGLAGGVSVGTGVDSQAGFTLLRDEPVVVDDLTTETRFSGPPLLHDHGVRSGMSTLIRTAAGSWGVLGVHTPRHRAFTSDDVNFLRAVANTVGAAIDRAAVEEELRHRGLHDALTDLPNRALLADRLEIGIARARRASRYVAVVHIGLDRFTLVNESFGQATGDRVLVEVARRLTDLCGPGDTAARLEGDEFVLSAIVDDAHSAVDLAARALGAIGDPVIVGEPPEEVFLSASIGVAVANGVGDAASLLRDAGIAAGRASARGGRRYELFDDRIRTRALERLRTERELRRALAQGEFEAHYQPVVRIEDGALVGVEALARWRHPTRGLLGPGDFLDAAEAAGLVAALGEAMLTQAARNATRWNPPGASLLPVSVNVSTLQLDSTIVDTIRDVLRTTGAPPESLCLEIVETALADDGGTALRVLHQLKELGPLGIHIDDFGTGHSSLSRLATFPVDGIKIDRSFVTNLAHNPTDRAVAAAVIHLGDALGLRVVAEGVETPEQLRILRDMGCHLAQGWLFAPAMAAGEVDSLVAAAPTAYAHIVAGDSGGPRRDGCQPPRRPPDPGRGPHGGGLSGPLAVRPG
jgi:diguanylate cyclase (GGDEF)-like protein/PAS domain S-box-containing protein